MSAYCDFQTKVKRLGENVTVQVEPCNSAGCYEHKIDVEASEHHLLALFREASECKQSIQVDCFLAPLEVST